MFGILKQSIRKVPAYLSRGKMDGKIPNLAYVWSTKNLKLKILFICNHIDLIMILKAHS